MQTLLQDLRYAFRLLLKTPAFTAIAILTLALGIGANTAIFSVVNAVLLRPLAYRDASRLIIVAEKSNFPVISTSYQNYADWRAQSSSFESLEGTRATTITLTGAGEPQRLNARMVTAPLFPLLGADTRLGRNFRQDEDRAGATPVAILSYGLWQRNFGGAFDVIGKSIDLDTRPYTIVGVMPAGFELFQPTDVFLPFQPWAATLPDDRNWHPGIIVVGRLKQGVTREQARTEMLGITKRLEQQYPEYNTGTSADVVPLQQQMVQNVRPALILLLGAVTFVLLIACANVANLLLARAAARGREVAIRTSMGASRVRVIRQLLTESVLLARWRNSRPSARASLARPAPQNLRRHRPASFLRNSRPLRSRLYDRRLRHHRPDLRPRPSAAHHQARSPRNAQRRLARLDLRPRPSAPPRFPDLRRNRAGDAPPSRIWPPPSQFRTHARRPIISRPTISLSPIFRSHKPPTLVPSSVTASTTVSSIALARFPESARPQARPIFPSAAAAASSTSTSLATRRSRRMNT